MFIKDLNDEYKEFLKKERGIGEDSIPSYCAGLNGLLNEIYGNDYVNIEINRAGIRTVSFDEFIHKTFIELRDRIDNSSYYSHPKGTYQNYFTYFSAFESFLQNRFYLDVQNFRPVSSVSSHIQYKICGYNIIDINKYPILRELRENLYKKNNQAFDLMDKLDTSELLKREGYANNGMRINDALKDSKYILFSSDIPMKTYGKYNYGDLIKAIGDLISKIDNSSLNDEKKRTLISILKELLHPNWDCKNIEVRQSLKNAIKEINENLSDIEKDDFNDIFDALGELEKTIYGLKFSKQIWGIHCVDNHTNRPVVIIFLNNILGMLAGNESFEKDELYDTYPNININIERTYIHELFHMIHLGMEVQVYNKDYADKVVIEGLARYFEIVYSSKYFSTDKYMELDELYRKYSVVSYPYTGAYYIERFDKNLFGDIVDKSTHGNHMAIHYLLQGTKELDIIIKNL